MVGLLSQSLGWACGAVQVQGVELLSMGSVVISLMVCEGGEDPTLRLIRAVLVLVWVLNAD